MPSSRILQPAQVGKIEPWTWDLNEKDSGSSRVPIAEVMQEDRHIKHPASISAVHEPRAALADPTQHSFDEGFAAGRTATEQALQQRFADLARAIGSVLPQLERMRREAETDQVIIAVAVARRILNREIHIDSDALRGLIGAAMAKARPSKALRVLVEPSLRDGIVRALAVLPGGSEIQVEADTRLTSGSILLETTRGTLDASIETQLKEIESGLLDQLERTWSP
jgi:flagellar assembly protein FliH